MVELRLHFPENTVIISERQLFANIRYQKYNINSSILVTPCTIIE